MDLSLRLSSHSTRRCMEVSGAVRWHALIVVPFGFCVRFLHMHARSICSKCSRVYPFIRACTYKHTHTHRHTHTHTQTHKHKHRERERHTHTHTHARTHTHTHAPSRTFAHFGHLTHSQRSCLKMSLLQQRGLSTAVVWEVLNGAVTSLGL